MLSYFIPLAVISTAPLLSNASPILPIGPIVPAAAVAATVTATATLTLFQCPTASPTSGGFRVVLVNPVLSSAVSAVTGLPIALPIIPSGWIFQHHQQRPVQRHRPCQPQHPPERPECPHPFQPGQRRLKRSERRHGSRQPHLRPASSVVSNAASFIRDPIAVPTGVVPNPIVIPSGGISSIGKFVSSVVSDAISLLPVGAIPFNGGAGLPTGVLSSAISSASGTAGNVSTILIPLNQVSTSLNSVSSAMPSLLSTVSSFLSSLTNLGGSLSQLNTRLSNLVTRLNSAAASIQSLNIVLSGLSSSTSSPADAAQFLNQGTSIAQRVASLTTQMNTVVSGCHQSSTPIDLAALRTALKTLQPRLQPALRHPVAVACPQQHLDNYGCCAQHLHPQDMILFFGIGDSVELAAVRKQDAYVTQQLR
ncbi:hypothetical protein B0H17DRAFT_1130991 [Mycena rosella]|uniref:Uncharacterized protein n=1 Tax=Mycena rosella TaxID=1033263 RepID=A0AAD7DNS8_MYCRO|nr:hypothetical protein B0H17DRAFT_1130991 [Mycena rosella]